MVGPDEVVPFRAEELTRWAMSGQGGFAIVEDGVLESDGGPGLFWYRGREFADEGRTLRPEAPGQG